MTYIDIFFDLDGTLTDSGPGIMRCASLALGNFDISEKDVGNLRRFIGPPLYDSFVDFYGFSEEEANEAVRIFRAEYTVSGIFENYPYPGIDSCLSALRDMGKRLYVATSKPEALALQVLDRFDLTKYFTLVGGATMDISRARKNDVLRYMIESAGSFDKNTAVMVGDRFYDMNGASLFGLHAVGVTYGYGSKQELIDSGAEKIADDTSELLEILSH